MLAGEMLYRAGDPIDEFFVALEGATDTVVGQGPVESVVAGFGPHMFLGELAILTGQVVAYLSARVGTDARVWLLNRRVSAAKEATELGRVPLTRCSLCGGTGFEPVSFAL